MQAYILYILQLLDSSVISLPEHVRDGRSLPNSFDNTFCSQFVSDFVVTIITPAILCDILVCLTRA